MDIKNFKIINSKNYFNKKKLSYEIKIKKKKIKKIIIKDGNFKIFLDLNDLYCSYCRSKDCFHIIFIYNEYFKIKFNLVPLIFCNKFYYNFTEYKEETFNEYCISYLNSKECCCCLDEISSKEDIWKCNNCNNLLHYKCIKEWIKQKNECPLCKQKIIKDIETKIN